MYQTVGYENLKGNYLLIDVRSPGEHENATIPGAVSLPLFDDDQRSRIGHVYVNESIERAKKIGIEVVALRLPDLYDKIVQWNKDFDKLIFFCAKGGMRSASLVALMVELGVKAFKLKDGYKGYRAFINAALPQVNKGVHYIVLHGKTGTGKTQLLKKLMEKGDDILDLEEAAGHRGSLLGSVGLGPARSQKQFESLIYDSLCQKSGPFIFVEGESKRIGNIIIPQYIFEAMSAGTHILVEASMEFRAESLVKEYTQGENFEDEIAIAIDAIGKYIGQKKAHTYIELLRSGNYMKLAIELMDKYYDPMYSNEFSKYEFALTVQIEDIESGVGIIEGWYREWIKKQEVSNERL